LLSNRALGTRPSALRAAVPRAATQRYPGPKLTPVRDPCEPTLAATPHTSAAAGWFWSQPNPPKQANDLLPGKWMLFPGCADAVATWRIVANAGHDGQIWTAKIAPRAQGTSHLICVYTPDFTDLAEVEAVALRLDGLGLAPSRMYYKPDIFTYAGIYNPPGRLRGQASTYEYRPSDKRIRPTPGLSRAHQLLAQLRPAST
jgi:Bles03-like protein